MSFKVIIPARYASTRLPGKPLLDVGGKPMVQRVYEQALKSDADEVIIATDDSRIEEFAKKLGAAVCMTSAEHESGTDRLQEVAAKRQFADDEIVINVQGDEPLIPPGVINYVAEDLAQHPQAGISTLYEKIDELELVMDPNVVKIVFDKQGYALYFSRAPVPWSRDFFSSKEPRLPAGSQYYRHIGVYGYRVSLLHQFVSWPMSNLELVERLEQLRAMENASRIHCAEVPETIPGGVDTEEDLERVRALMAKK